MYQNTDNMAARLRLFFTSFLLSCALYSGAQENWGYEYDWDIPEYIDSIQAHLTYPLAWRNNKNMPIDKWRETTRTKIHELMGPEPPRPTKWEWRVLAEEKRNSYKAMRIEFNLSVWYKVKAYILIPDGKGPFPTVNLLHDHGAHLFIGKEKMIRPFAVDTVVVNDAQRWCDMLYEGQYLGDYLAKNGYVVFSIDAPLWGERARREGADRNMYDIIAGNMMAIGQNLCAYMHYDDIASTNFLSTLPFVDKKRIGAAGCSMGAYRAWMLAALSDKVKVTCADCWMGSTFAQYSRKYGRKENGAFANCIPLLRNYMDYPDIASLAVPKPTLFIHGLQDKLFPKAGVDAAFSVMHDVWDAAGAGDKLTTIMLDQKHECNKNDQKIMLDFLNKYLK